MKIIAKVIGDAKQFEKWKKLAAAIEKTVDANVKPRLLSYGERVTDPWEHQVKWATRKTVKNGALTLYMWPSTNKDIWTFVSRGTKPHIIKPRYKKALAFPTGYQPHTKPSGPSYSGPGVASGPTVVRDHVHHPGTKGRHFEEAFGRWIKPYLERMIREAIAEGVK